MLAFLLSTAVLGQRGKITFNLHDKADTKEKLNAFIHAMKDGNFKKEFAFRTDKVLWRYKSVYALPDTIPADSSFADIGYLNQLKFVDIAVDTNMNMIMRTFYVEPHDIRLKHRYAFIINEEGLVSEILYVPPITKEYFPEWEDEDFAELANLIDEESNVATYMDPEVFEFHAYGCGGVMPALMELEESEILEEIEESVPEKIEEPVEEIEPIEERAVWKVPYRSIR